ncbi:unnamed protein product, partial [Adineta steineri]
MANRPSRSRTTEDDAVKLIEAQGYKKTNFFLHGRSVYYNPDKPKNMQYITYDKDGHNGGIWKAGNKQWVEKGAGAISPDQIKAAQLHEVNVYKMVKLAAKCVVALTGSEVYVIRPTSPHVHSEHGYSIKPDVIVIIKDQDNKSIIIDAKNHVARIPSGQWKKLKRDMKE